ncbi:phosphatase PAP2 family protein [bacterium]|nr:phosphatase PAP2 family protein [bacterium]
MNKKNIVFYSLILLFVLWVSLILTDNVSWFDEPIYNFIIGFKSPGLSRFMACITALSNPTVIVFLCVLSLLFLIVHKRWPIALVGTSLISVAFNQGLKNIIKRPRPDHLRLIEEGGYSFPSGHAMGSMAFYGFIILILCKLNINKCLKCILIILLSVLILLIGISRVYLGVHYPSDIFGGYLLSLALIIKCFEIFEKRKFV